MKRAQKMHSVGKIGSAALTILIEQPRKMRVGFAAIDGDTLDLRQGNRLRLVFERTIDGHTHPLRSTKRQLRPILGARM